MAKKKPKPDDKEQSKRFIDKAKEITGDDAEESFEHAMKKVIPPDRRRVPAKS